MDAWECRIRYKCLGPVEWRPDVDGKMGKKWILLKRFIFFSLLILVWATKHDNRVGDIAKKVWILHCFLCFFALQWCQNGIIFFLTISVIWWVMFYMESSQVCLVYLGKASSFTVSSPKEVSVSNRTWAYCFSNFWPRSLAPFSSFSGTGEYQLLCGAGGDLLKVEIIHSSVGT